MTGFWMVRAGSGGSLIEAFEAKNCVAIGWGALGDLSDATTLDQIRERIKTAYPGRQAASAASVAAMTFKFRRTMEIGDSVVTYDPSAREYLLGTIRSEYRFEAGRVPDHDHVREVQWVGRIPRDRLSATAKGSLAGALTVFQPGEAVLEELRAALHGEASRPSEPAGHAATDDPLDEVDALRRDVIEQAHEFIKDRILALSPDDMEDLVAALLRAMGFKTRVTPKGPDRGRDVVASPDGLGLEQPRVVAEVKHRGGAIGAPAVRAFLGGLRPSDRGLYVSTGGFTREAGYEAERAAVPITLVTLGDLAELVVEHYEAFDLDGRALLPLVRVYWPKG